MNSVETGRKYLGGRVVKRKWTVHSVHPDRAAKRKQRIPLQCRSPFWCLEMRVVSQSVGGNTGLKNPAMSWSFTLILVTRLRESTTQHRSATPQAPRPCPFRFSLLATWRVTKRPDALEVRLRDSVALGTLVRKVERKGGGGGGDSGCRS